MIVPSGWGLGNRRGTGALAPGGLAGITAPGSIHGALASRVESPEDCVLRGTYHVLPG